MATLVCFFVIARSPEATVAIPLSQRLLRHFSPRNDRMIRYSMTSSIGPKLSAPEAVEVFVSAAAPMVHIFGKGR